ncbi:hypothetical protein ACFODX_10380 [Cellvibrio fontiphilus]|uniref:Uncharacterized protein n=1 Tax=Cellvibrio fontiphilus TaxID=1815559 RepID=A0ABV7FEC5_9GAMM
MKRIITLSIAALIANILMINTANANECWRIERQLNEAEYRLRQGGNQSYMKMWQKSRDHNAEELPKCLKRFGISNPSISVANGSGAANHQYYANEALVPIDTNNPQLQQVIKTCNYWIQQHNQNADENNRVMRNTACENVNRMRRELSNDKPQEQFTPVRSLKECAKPNNVFDNEVKECMQGLREPK